ncbi:MAG: glycosyltransferase [Candidatus Woesearchaeota archaeon]
MKWNLSIIIPVFREENRIERCIKESLFFLNNCKKINKFEIIFVADKSGDKTIDIIRKHAAREKRIKLIVNKKREEKGGSVKIGMLRAKYELMMFYDADLSTPLYEINKFLELIPKYDILIASRGLKDSKVQKKPFKILLSRIFSILKRILLGIKFKDTQCGFKMFKRKCRVLFEKQRIKSDAFDVEILYLAQKMGFRIKEVPVTWIDSDMSNFRTFEVILRFKRDLIKIKINDAKGVYEKDKQ